MKTFQFRFSFGLAAVLAIALGAFAMDAAAAGAKTHTAAPKKAEPAKPVGEVVEYASLENRIGQTVSIETTFKTTRTGKLVKYTQPALTIEMGSEANPMELTVPKETIKTITVLTPPATPAAEPAKDAGTSGAKKN